MWTKGPSVVCIEVTSDYHLTFVHQAKPNPASGQLDTTPPSEMPESETLQQALKSYSSAREALVLEEKRLRSDWKPQAEISRIEIEALKAVEKVRIEERENIWESEPTRPFLL